ncbi:hypothetical protein [Streptomyces sp. NRRL S-244]|uniref:hypothetical protein n=1 Tax=Streptomyces sp. NRRL S-244 TaxID=1463897 RepID=UPI00131A5BB0|nr:hypothetical protein [Streptomyces sp. NRRL S-244]
MPSFKESLRREANATFRRVVSEAVAAVDDLPGLDDTQRNVLRRKVRRSVSRSRGANRYRVRLWYPVVNFIVVASMLGLIAATSAWMKHWNREPDGGEIGIGLAIGFILLSAVVLVPSKTSGQNRRNRLLKQFFFLAFVAYPSSILTYALTQDPWVSYIAGAAIIPISIFISSLFVVTIMGKVMRRRPVSADSVYDRTALAMLETAALVSRSRSEWQSSTVSRRVVAAIEDLARTCQGGLSLRSRVGRWHADVFSRTAVEALRVAHVVREHKKLIVCASSAEDFDKVAISLSSGLDALLANDRSKLLEHAPDVVLKERVRVVVRHLIPVVLLIAAAVILPMIPPLSGQDKVADSVRLTFIVAAVLALVAPRSESSTRILDTLSKATSSK